MIPHKARQRRSLHTRVVDKPYTNPAILTATPPRLDGTHPCRARPYSGVPYLNNPDSKFQLHRMTKRAMSANSSGVGVGVGEVDDVDDVQNRPSPIAAPVSQGHR